MVNEPHPLWCPMLSDIGGFVTTQTRESPQKPHHTGGRMHSPLELLTGWKTVVSRIEVEKPTRHKVTRNAEARADSMSKMDVHVRRTGA